MPKAIPGRVATQIRINETVYSKVRLIAEMENRNTNSQIEYFLRQCVESYEKEHGLIDLRG